MTKPVILKSDVISTFPGLIHGISTCLGGSTDPPYLNNMSFKVGDDKERTQSNRDKFFTTLGIDQTKLAIPQQVHSGNVKVISAPGFYPDTDALITTEKELFLIISTADCFSILIHDDKRPAVAAVHSGWRGTQKKILTSVISTLLSETGCNQNDLHFFIGPGICKEHFEVGKDVSEMFDKKYVTLKNGKYFVDLNEHILDQLRSFDIPSTQIDISPYCTFEEAGYLHSYRRDKTNSGRMFSVIGMR